jgi:hypothetical protein
VPTIQMPDPLSAAAEAVGNFLQQKRTNVVDQQARDFQQRQADRAQSNSDRTFGLQEGEAADAHQRAQSDLKTAEQQRSIATETSAYEAKMRPLMLEAQRASNALAQGQAVAQKDLHALQQLQLSDQKFNSYLLHKYGESAQQMLIKREQAGIDASRAGTAATQQRTSQDAALFPGVQQEQGVRIEGERLQNTGTGLLNEGRRLQNTFERQQINAPAASPELQRDYRAQLSSFTQRTKDYDRRAAHNQLQPNEAPPQAPVSPEDFTATLADSVDALKKSPSDLPKMLAAVDAMPGLSPYQKRQAHLALTAAVKNVTQLPQSAPYGLELGGSHAAGPFQLPAFPGTSGPR